MGWRHSSVSYWLWSRTSQLPPCFPPIEWEPGDTPHGGCGPGAGSAVHLRWCPIWFSFQGSSSRSLGTRDRCPPRRTESSPGGGAVVTRACKGQSTPWAPGRSCPESGSPALRPLAREGLDTPAPALLAQKPILMAPGHPDRFPRPQAGGGRPPPDILQQESRGRWEQHPGPSTHSEFLVHQPVL